MKRAIEYFAEFMVYLVMTMLVCYLVLMFLSMIIKEAIQVLIETIEPSYETTGSYQYPLPNEVTLSLDSDSYVIDLNLKEGVLKAEIWNAEDEIELTDKDVDFIYNYLNGLLEEEIDLTKRYYEEEKYQEQTSYYIR